MRKRIFAVSTLLLLVITILSVIFSVNTELESNIDYKNTNVCGPINSEKTIRYVFTCDKDVAGFKLLIGTYGKNILEGRIIVSIYDYSTKEELGEAVIEAEYLRDNQFAFADTGILKTKDRKIIVDITGRGFKRYFQPTIWTGTNDLDDNSKTYINNKSSNDQLIINTCYISKQHPFTWELVLLTAISFLLYCCQTEEKKIEQSESSEEIATDEQHEEENN